MKSIIESVSAFFAAEQWPARQVGGRNLSMRFKGNQFEWDCVASTDEDERTLVFYSLCPATAGKDSFPRVAELLCRLNYAQLCGNFELGYLDGDIRFRTSIEVPDIDLSHALIDRVVYNNVATMDMFLPALLSVIQDGTAPLEAIARS